MSICPSDDRGGSWKWLSILVVGSGDLFRSLGAVNSLVRRSSHLESGSPPRAPPQLRDKRSQSSGCPGLLRRRGGWLPDPAGQSGGFVFVGDSMTPLLLWARMTPPEDVEPCPHRSPRTGLSMRPAWWPQGRAARVQKGGLQPPLPIRLGADHLKKDHPWVSQRGVFADSEHPALA